MSSPLSSFVDFLSSVLGREFLSIHRRSVSRFFGNFASSPTYNEDHHRIETKILAKGKMVKLYLSQNVLA